ncbi:hypothetical protein Bbelb_083820 [Branchiostoma belcheri]|nr:hypothetical protein Bbelb_083820 [Branchiostoma belcheri]
MTPGDSHKNTCSLPVTQIEDIERELYPVTSDSIGPAQLARQDVKKNIWHAAIGVRSRGRPRGLAPSFFATRYAGHDRPPERIPGRSRNLPRDIPQTPAGYRTKSRIPIMLIPRSVL